MSKNNLTNIFRYGIMTISKDIFLGGKMSYFNNHNHTEYSNASCGFPDVINRVEDLIQNAYNLGLDGITITDHECLSSHIQALKYYNSMEKERKFILALGNEIYLMEEQEDVNNRDNDEHNPYYHFILTALDTIGHKQLRELSDRAWERAYKKFIYRRPTYYSDLEEIIKSNQGHIIASTACLGSRIDHLLLEQKFDEAKKEIKRLINIFGKDNLYLEIQPSKDINTDQSVVNKQMFWLGGEVGLPIIPTTDSHYLRKEDAEIHRVYLNSQEGDREVDDFYATAYLMDEEELRNYLHHEFTDEQINQMFKWSCELGERIKEYNIFHKPIIPSIPHDKIPEFHIKNTFNKYYDFYPYFAYYAISDKRNLQEKYFFYQIECGLQEKVVNRGKDVEKYIARLDEEWKELKIISDELNTSMASYYSTMSKIIDLIWEAGSLAMPARGSSAGFLTCYLLEVTQIDPVPLGDYFPSWRHLNHERGVELPDIDNDSEASKKQDIVNKMKEYFGEDKVLNVATFSKISSKTAIERACKGLGISNDTAAYLKSLIPRNRGEILNLKEAIYGNKNKDFSPVAGLKNEMNKYPNLIKCALGIEGLITNRGTHAAGVIVCNEPYTNYISSMRSADGTLTTCYDLWDSEEAGCIKFDMLTVEAADKIHRTMDYLLENNKITWEGSLKATYYKWLHPDVINYDNKKMWDILPSIYSVFQFDTPISQKTLSATKPHSVMDLSAANSLLRLMPDNADETPINKYKRYKDNHKEWINDTIKFGLNDEERQILWEYLSDAYGMADSQEKVMRLSMDKRTAGYSLKEANKLRKSIAKKDKKLQAEAKELFFEYCKKQGTREIFADYIWNVVFSASFGYSFSQLHSYSYSIIALQELNLNYFYPSVYWNCACLSVEASGMTEDGKSGSTDYGEVSKAIYKMRQSNISVSPPSINESEIDFTPDEEKNLIYFGLGGIAGINGQLSEQIIQNRPYASFKDFYEKNTFQGSLITTSKFIQLIKAGCFDEFCKDRVKVMKQFFVLSNPKPTQLTAQNITSIKSVMKLPKEIFGFYNFYKYIVDKKYLYGNHPKFKSKKLYWLDDKALKYFNKNCESFLTNGVDFWEENEKVIVVDKSIEKLLKPDMERIKEYINTQEFINQYYKALLNKKFNEAFENQDPNHWSMEATSYYSLDHEMHNINYNKYNLFSFNELPEEPMFIERNAKGRSWKQFELYAICGTVIDKNDNNHFFSILTPENKVVNCKLNGGAYAFYKAQYSEIINGKKEVIEKPWIARGNMLIVCGYRRDDDFVCKTYNNSIYQHQLQKINEIYDDGTLNIQTERIYIE